MVEDAESQVPEAPGDLQRAGAGHERLVQLAEQRVDVRHERADPASPAVVVQPLGEGLGLAQALQRPPDFTELAQHRPQLEADLEALLQRGRALRQRLEDAQRLLEPDPGVRERRPRGRLESGLPEIVHRLLPQLAPEGVMGEPLDLLAEAIPVERLDRVDDPRVKLAAPLLQQAAVRDLVGERVLEGVLEIREEPGLVEELGGLQVVEPATERLVRQLGDRLEQRERHVLADDRGGLQEALVLRAAAGRCAASIACTVAGTWMLSAIVGALWGSSWHLVSGPTNATSLMVFATVGALAVPFTPTYVALVLTLNLMVGLMKLGLGLARLGSLVNFISTAVVIGFTAGAGLLIIGAQLRNFFGISVPQEPTFLLGFAISSRISTRRIPPYWPSARSRCSPRSQASAGGRACPTC